jgi:hypothetical protein
MMRTSLTTTDDLSERSALLVTLPPLTEGASEIVE